MVTKEKEPKDHPLWPGFIEWWVNGGGLYGGNWSLFWECFLAGARAENRRMLEAT